MGESKLKVAKREEMLLSCSGMQTMAGRVQARWESASAAMPMGQLAYFIEFLNLTGLWSRWLEGCPLTYSCPNAPTKAEVLGTWLLSMLAGHCRYSHVTAIRCDGINPTSASSSCRRTSSATSANSLASRAGRMPAKDGKGWKVNWR